MRVSELMEPEIVFPGAYLIFLFLALTSFYIPSSSSLLLPTFGMPRPLALGISILGIALFAIGARAGKNRGAVPEPEFLLPFLAFVSFFTLQLTFPRFLALNLLVAFLFPLFLYSFSPYLGNHRLLALGSLCIALLASLATLASGIPVLTPGAREEVAVSPQRAAFHGFGMLAAVLLVAFFRRRHSVPLLLGLAFLGLLSGFKSDAVSIIIAALLTGLFTEKFGTREALGALIGVAGILTLVSTLIARVSHGVWHLSPLAYPSYRAGFTFSIFDRIVHGALPWGLTHGKAITDTSQVIASQVILEYQEEHIITSTLFGPPVLDFGIPGLVATSLLLGYYLGALRGLATTKFSKAIYAMALTHMLILIEVGLQLSSLIFFTFLFYLSKREKVYEV